MMHPHRRRWPVVAVAGLAMALVACGAEPDEPPLADEPPEDAVDEPAPPDPDDGAVTENGDAPEDGDAPENGDAPEDDDAPENGDSDGPPDVVTEDHDGETIALPQDGAVRLQLSSDWVWDEPAQDGTSIELVRVDYLVDPGYMEWEVQVLAPGVTNVSVTGEPNCANPDDCPRRTVEIRFEVVG